MGHLLFRVQSGLFGTGFGYPIARVDVATLSLEKSFPDKRMRSLSYSTKVSVLVSLAR